MITEPVLRVRRLLFSRDPTADGLRCLPVRASRFAPVPDYDWFRDEKAVGAGAVAFPVGLGAQPTLRLEAELDVLDGFSGPLFVRAVPHGSRLLGTVLPTPVIVPGQISDLKLDLHGHELAGAAVGQHEVRLAWQHSEDEFDWIDFDETAHLAFTVLDRPAPPWGCPGDPQTVVPWLEPMETACRWAKGVRDPKAALDRITRSLSALGGQQIGHGTLEYGGNSVTSGRKFYMTKFLLAVAGDPHGPRAMNCTDLASALAVFAAQLGCRARALRLTPKHGDGCDMLQTNRVRLFGRSFDGSESFFFHEAVQLEAAPVVWDACASVDFDDRPERNPPAHLGLPTGIGLHGAQEPAGIGYIARLLQPSDRDCQTMPPGGDGIRYPDPVPDGVSDALDPFEVARRRCLREDMRGMPSSERTDAAKNGGLEAWLRFVTRGRTLDGSSIGESLPPGLVPVRLLNDDANASADIFFRLGSTREESVELLLHLLTGYAHALRRCPNLGDFAMCGDRDETVYMLRGSVVAVILGRRNATESALDTAREFDRQLSNYLAVPAS